MQNRHKWKQIWRLFSLSACGLLCINGGFLHQMWASWKNTLKWCMFFSPFSPPSVSKKLKANWRPVLHDKLRPLLSTHLLKFSSKCSPQQERCVLLAWVITFIPLHKQVGRPYIPDTSLRADEHFLNQTERSSLENCLSLISVCTYPRWDQGQQSQL